MTLWTDFLGAEVRFVEAGGVRTRIVAAGAGDRVLVLLHGRGGHLESWRANVGPLAERGVRVVAFDLLGHGLTGRGDRYGVDDLTDHAEAVLDVLGLRRVTLVGQSLGGWVAARLAQRRPDLVRALGLIEPAGLQSEAERLSDPMMAAAYERGGRAYDEPTADAVRERLTGLVADPAAIDDELVETRRRLYAPAAARDVHRAVRRADNAGALIGRLDLGIPVFLSHGEHGHTPAAVLARAGGRLTTVPGARQWPQLERPDIVNPLLLELATGGTP